MSEFNGQGFPSYPNLHLDSEAVHSVVEWPDAALNRKTAEYREFVRRPHLMQRHRLFGELTLRALEFECDCRDGIYELQQDIDKLQETQNV